MVVKIDLITHNIRNIGKIGRCILVKAYDLSKLIHALEISNHNAVKCLFSKINRYGISEFRPGQFADHRCNRNLIFVLRNYSIDIFIRGCFRMDSLLTTDGIIFSVKMNLIFVLRFHTQFRRHSVFLKQCFRFCKVLLDLLSSIRIHTTHRFRQIGVVQITPRSECCNKRIASHG